jgi:hypothetical protein
MNSYKSYALDSLYTKAETDRNEALASLAIMLDHPAGIGDHSTSDLHNNLNEALAKLADAEDRLQTLRKFFP